MELEYRFRDFDKSKLSKLQKNGISIIGFGDEGCVLRIPNTFECKEIFQTIVNLGLKAHFVTPKLSQINISRMIDFLTKIDNIEQSLILTVNDFGLLYELKMNNISPNLLLLGRFISREMCDAPWAKNILDEDMAMRDKVMANSMADPYKIRFFEKYGVGGVESFLHRDLLSTYNYFNKNDYKTYCHTGNSLVAYSRICQTAKFKNISYDSCINACNVPIPIELNTLYNSIGDFENLPEHIDTHNMNMYLLGNMVFADIIPSLNKEDIIDTIDVLILDEWDCEKSHTITEFFGGEKI